MSTDADLSGVQSQSVVAVSGVKRVRRGECLRCTRKEVLDQVSRYRKPLKCTSVSGVEKSSSQEVPTIQGENIHKSWLDILKNIPERASIISRRRLIAFSVTLSIGSSAVQSVCLNGRNGPSRQCHSM